MNMEVEMNRNAMKDLSKDAVFLFILSKIDQYKGEKEFFKNKYKQDFQEVEREAHSIKGREDFQLEEDLEDWETEYSNIKNNAAVA